MFTKWWNSIKTFVYFFRTDSRHTCRKNTTEITTIYWNALLWIFPNWFLTFSSRLGGMKRLHGQVFVQAKLDPGCTKERSRLAGMKCFTCNCKIIVYKEFVTLLGSWQNGKEFHAGQPGSWNNYLIIPSFVICHFSHCRFLWMFHSQKLNSRISRLYERALAVLYGTKYLRVDQVKFVDNSL